jgi:hypothetical protein
MREKGVLIARYEDLLTDYEKESRRLVEFLPLESNRAEVRQVIDSYRPGAAEGQQGLHFYKGKIGRFREAYSPAEQDILREKLGPYLQRMRYEV